MSQKICDYGCGQKAKYSLKNGRWSCCQKWFHCPKIRENARQKSLEQFGDSEKREIHKKSQRKRWNNATDETKQKHRDKMNFYWNTGNNRKIHGDKIKEVWKNEGFRENIVIKHKNWWKITENRIKGIKVSILTIEQIHQRYPTFCKVEDIRYNPYKPEENEFQVRCKYSKCKNSKENNGWFTPTRGQLYNRIASIELPDGRDTSYMYCSLECRSSCCLFKLHTDPFELVRYNRYTNEVIKYTGQTVKKFSNKIKNMKLRGKKFGYDLDHKYSIYDGYHNNVDSRTISHWKNLEILTIEENRIKNRNSSVLLNEILDEIKNGKDN